MIEAEFILDIIRISEVGTTLEMIGIEVNVVEMIEEILRLKTDHMTEAEVEI